MQAYLGTIECKFDRDPVICLQEEAIYMYIMYIVTNRLQYFAPASRQSKYINAVENLKYTMNNISYRILYIKSSLSAVLMNSSNCHWFFSLTLTLTLEVKFDAYL